jgi:lipoate---protein ligase
MGLRVEHSTGSAADFHDRELPIDHRLVVWHFAVDRPAIVLGSRQHDDVLDLVACRDAGVEVVHRRSGGGLVHLVPGGVLWVDVVVPATDRRSISDVRGSMEWMGEQWVEALRRVGCSAGVVVHRGGLEHSSWSDLLCFAGIGPGEVLLDGRKLVGISQRRTRSAARFQCAVHLHAATADLLPADLLPAGVLGLLTPPLPPLGELPVVAALEPHLAPHLVDALVDVLNGVPPDAVPCTVR